MPTITPCLWFDGRVEEALEAYTALFPDSEVLAISRYSAAMPEREGEVLMAQLRLAGTEIQIINGGPAYQLTPAFSLSVSVPDQAEVDRLWEALTADGGRPDMCGWLTDPFGVSWQIVPEALPNLLSDPDPDKVARVTAAMLQMRKIVVADLEAAAAGSEA